MKMIKIGAYRKPSYNASRLDARVDASFKLILAELSNLLHVSNAEVLRAALSTFIKANNLKKKLSATLHPSIESGFNWRNAGYDYIKGKDMPSQSPLIEYIPKGGCSAKPTKKPVKKKRK